ncbi:MAG: peptidoglycan DD-metalloendopeptidase family protein [Bacteroidales bacterium]|nr:peptidoglycan DD-metalloendopeptidase family protein [Bacteroidales bacterium]
MKKIVRILFLAIALLMPVLGLFAQSKAELEKKKKKTINEINYTNKLLEETRKDQKVSENNLVLLGNQIVSRQELISEINMEISFVTKRIAETESIIAMMTEDLENLKESYAKMLKIAWKNQNKNNEIMFLLSSRDFNQSYLRLKYMKQIADYRKRQLLAINSIKAVLVKQMEKLIEQKAEHQKLLNDEKVETRNLENAKRQQESTLAKLRGKEADLKKQLAEKNKQKQQLQAAIEKLIAEEVKKSSAAKGKANTGKYELTPEEKIVSDNFGNNLGKLPWPVQRGVIVSRYGKQPHPVIPNVEIDNKGIDISTTTGSEARAVFDGEVRKVFSVPGTQNAVIIRHGEYLSVYTHIDRVYVSVGDKVKAKQTIGKIYTDDADNKTILHLEIWKGSTTLNPANWLAK